MRFWLDRGEVVVIGEDRARGAYILLLRNDEDGWIWIGKRKLYFKQGYYIYCGSAMNNLKKRISRHFSYEKRLRWHIDYISIKMQPLLAFAIISEEKIECWLSKLIGKLFEAFDEFGASDCSCRTHLFYSPSNPIHKLETLLRENRLSFTLYYEIPNPAGKRLFNLR
ncbi:DUF123 domain-containing protein [Archaeoglobales archaeon]|nr:MAG: DUF123 domain-containing protein [Archaeoglobales archaeon]